MTSTKKPWRVVDIVTAAVLGVACGVLFWAWAALWNVIDPAVAAVTPGFDGLLLGPWLLGAVLGGLVIRKPGAALLVELVAASVEMLLGNAWGLTTLYSGVAQGLAAELVFFAFAYRRANLLVAALAGAAAAAAEWAVELFTYANLSKDLAFNAIYLATSVASGIVLAGALGWWLVKELANTGALDRFAAGTQARERV